MIILDTYNGNEILRKYSKKGDTYKMYRVHTHTHTQTRARARTHARTHTHNVYVRTHTWYFIITEQNTNEYRKIYNR